MRLLCFTIGGLLWVMLALAIYAKATRTLAMGVTLSIVGGESSCNADMDALTQRLFEITVGSCLNRGVHSPLVAPVAASVAACVAGGDGFW